MPARSNDFQRLVFLIQTQLADSRLVGVTESKMLADKRTGTKREVDVVVEFVQQGAPFILSIECRDTERKLDIEKMEQLIKKHEVRSDKLIVVSRRGFTKSAAELALQHRVEVVTLEVATNVDWSAYIERLDNLRLGLFNLKIETFNIDYTRLNEAAPFLDVSKECTVINARGERAPLREWMGVLLQHEKIRGPVMCPVMDAWFLTPEDKRREVFRLQFRVQTNRRTSRDLAR